MMKKWMLHMPSATIEILTVVSPRQHAHYMPFLLLKCQFKLQDSSQHAVFSFHLHRTRTLPDVIVDGISVLTGFHLLLDTSIPHVSILAMGWFRQAQRVGTPGVI